MLSQERYNAYDTWAWLYNETMGPEYSKGQLQLLERVLLFNIPANSKIFDLCCGTGQLIQPLLDRGFQVTGLDGSETMLKYAQKNAPDAEFWLDDARHFSKPAQFEAAFSTSASLNHIMSLEELTKVFRNVYDVLKPGGIFLFDLNHPGQMAKWWRGQIAEGEIHGRYAWHLTPQYDAAADQGKFEVSVFETSAKPKSLPAKALQPLKKVLYKILSLRRLTRFRLKLLANFAALEPSWRTSKLDYPVKGHRIDEVQAALERVGFTQIQVETIEGDTTIDDNHSAHFICRRGTAS